VALNFDATGGQYVNHGSDASLDNLDTFTYVIGVTPAATGQEAGLLTKGLGGGGSRRSLELANGGAGSTTSSILVAVDRATTDAFAASSGSIYSVGDRLFVAVAFDLAGGPNIYLSVDEAPVSEVSYFAGPTTGAGATGDNSGNTQNVGAYGFPDFGNFNGDVWFAAIYNVRLTVAQVEQQLRQLWAPVAAGCVLFKPDYGLVDGTGTQRDRTGPNDGTITGTGITAVDHPALSGWMPQTGVPVTAGSVVLGVAESALGSAFDAPALVQGHVLAVDDVAIASAWEAPTLTQAQVLEPDDVVLATTFEGLALTQAHVLAVQDAALASAWESPTLSLSTLLEVADALMASSFEAPALTQAHLLAVADALLASSWGAPAPTQANVLTVSDALMATLFDDLALLGLIVSLRPPHVATARARISVVTALPRTLTVDASARISTVTAV
jgi:hypothetical protein